MQLTIIATIKQLLLRKTIIIATITVWTRVSLHNSHYYCVNTIVTA